MGGLLAGLWKCVLQGWDRRQFCFLVWGLLGIWLSVLRNSNRNITKFAVLHVDVWKKDLLNTDYKCHRLDTSLSLTVCLWRNSPKRARAASFLMFLDHTQWHTTVSRSPLDGWSARRRDLYLTDNIHNKYRCTRRDSKQQSQHALARATLNLNSRTHDRSKQFRPQC